MADDAKKAAVVNIVRQALISWGKKDTEPMEDVLPKCYEDLQDGVFLYTVLSRIAPESFPNAAEIETQTTESRENWVVRKGNIMLFVRHMNDHVHQHFGAPNTLDLTLLIDAADIASPRAQGDDLTNRHAEQKSLAQFMELIDFFLVIIAFSGDPVVLQALRSLPHADKLLLSNAAKACITKHALRPRRRDETADLRDEARETRTVHCGVEFLSRGRATSSAFTVRQNSFSSPDDEAPHFQLLQLRRELEDANSKVVELDSKLQFALSEKQEWESKYKKMIGEVEQQRSAFAMEQHLRELLERKELAIKSLTATAEEHVKKIAAFKEATAAQEAALGVMKRKLSQTQGELMKQNVERREALEKLALAEEKLTVQVNARHDLERQLEDLRTELAIMKAQPDGTCGNDVLLNNSFGSVNSMDRVVQLENELYEVRSQKEAAERLLNVLQRQLSSLPSEGLKSSAATDALKAQLRQAEKEKEELRKQLAATIGRLEEAQCQWKGGHMCAQSVVDGETESITSGNKNTGEEMDADASLKKNGGNNVSIHRSLLREKRDEHYMREQTALASNLLLLGYRNLILQQRSFLTGNINNMINKSGSSNDAVGGCAFCTKTSKKENNEQKMNKGSFLTQHRLEVEKGLFESVFGRNI